jgi:chromate transport protein ChrA
MVDVVTIVILIFAILVWWQFKEQQMSPALKDAIGYGIFFFMLAFIVASRDPILIVIAMLFLLMKVFTTGAKPPKKFEDGISSKWFPQYP